MDSSELMENDLLPEIANGISDKNSAEGNSLMSTIETDSKQTLDISTMDVALADSDIDNRIVAESENETSMMSVESDLNEAVEMDESAIDSEVQEDTESRLCNTEVEKVSSEIESLEKKEEISLVAEDIDISIGENGDKDKDLPESKELDDSTKIAISCSEPKEVTDKDDPESASKQDPKSSSSKKDKKKSKNCAECGKKGKKFRLHYQGKNHNLCSEECYKNFKIKLGCNKSAASASSPAEEADGGKCAQCEQDVSAGYYPNVGEMKALCSEECVKKYQDDNVPPVECAQCNQHVTDIEKQLMWEMMVFCSEPCLGKYQSFLGSHCTCCQQPVQQPSLGKYCVCFGADIRQFCSGTCLEEFKKGLKVCTFCQTDLSTATDGFLAPVGEKGQFKDFCSPKCMERFETSNSISKTPPETQDCASCKKQGTYPIRVTFNNNIYYLCCDHCVAAFRCTHKVKNNMCDTCFNFFTPDEKKFSFKMDGICRYFCSKPCSTLYVLSHRKITQCVQCKVKKYNTDMIEKVELTGMSNMFCSLNCLSLFRVNSSATSGKSVRCDHCGKASLAQYHLTMSDGSIRNFCTYMCVIAYQNQFSSIPALTSTSNSRQQNSVVAKPAATSKGIIPQTLINVNQSRPQPSSTLSPKPQQTSVSSGSTSPSTPRGHGPREVIVRPPPPKGYKNKTVSCKPIMQTKGVNAKLQTCHKAVQTDDNPTPIFLPIPVPVYVPTPLHMFSRPVPCPVPFAVPIPIPVIIPIKDATSTSVPDSQEMRVQPSPFPYDVNLLKIPDLTLPPIQKSPSIDSGIKVLKDNVIQGNNHDKILTVPKIKEEIISDPSENEKAERKITLTDDENQNDLELASEDDFMKDTHRKRFGSPPFDNMEYKRPRPADIPENMESETVALFTDTFNEETEKNLKVH